MGRTSLGKFSLASLLHSLAPTFLCGVTNKRIPIYFTMQNQKNSTNMTKLISSTLWVILLGASITNFSPHVAIVYTNIKILK